MSAVHPTQPRGDRPIQAPLPSRTQDLEHDIEQGIEEHGIEAVLAENRRLRELVVQLSKLVVQNAIERR